MSLRCQPSSSVSHVVGDFIVYPVLNLKLKIVGAIPKQGRVTKRRSGCNGEVAAIEKTLLEDFKNTGIRHDDIAWRNVGVYYGKSGQLHAVVFDMQRVHCVTNEQEEDRVQAAITSLSQELLH
jgi:hypothetical protein